MKACLKQQQQQQVKETFVFDFDVLFGADCDLNERPGDAGEVVDGALHVPMDDFEELVRRGSADDGVDDVLFVVVVCLFVRARENKIKAWQRGLALELRILEDTRAAYSSETSFWRLRKSPCHVNPQIFLGSTGSKIMWRAK